MKYSVKPKGICPSKIDIELDGNVIKSISYTGGCNGNLKGIATIVEGMTIDHVIEKFSGIKCGFKSTSCPDQLAQALIKIKEEN